MLKMLRFSIGKRGLTKMIFPPGALGRPWDRHKTGFDESHLSTPWLLTIFLLGSFEFLSNFALLHDQNSGDFDPFA
jgi:hypothetical protein